MSPNITYKQAIQHAIQILEPQKNIENKQLEAEILLSYILKVERIHLHTWPENILTAEQYQEYQTIINKRALGNPIAHLTHFKEFWSLPLYIDDNVLIPRPETEKIIEIALELPIRNEAKVADLGTGSGAIAIALAHERPTWKVTATDLSLKALQTAQYNAQNLQLNNIDWGQGSWCYALSKTFHLIVSNPPYIALNDPHLQQGDLRFEPKLALTSGTDGLEAINSIIYCARQYLSNNGWLLIEHGYNQGDKVRKLFMAAGYKNVKTHRDYGNNERITQGNF